MMNDPSYEVFISDALDELVSNIPMLTDEDRLNGLMPYIVWMKGAKKIDEDGRILKKYPAGYIIGTIENKDLTKKIVVYDTKGQPLVIRPAKPLENGKKYRFDLIGTMISMSELASSPSGG